MGVEWDLVHDLLLLWLWIGLVMNWLLRCLIIRLFLLTGAPSPPALVLLYQLRWPPENVALVPRWLAYSQNQSIDTCHVGNDFHKVFFSFVPFIVLLGTSAKGYKPRVIELIRVIIGVQKPLPLSRKFPKTILLKLSFHFLPLLPDNINRITAFTIAKLAPVGWECSPPLGLGHLAEARFARF